MSKASSNPFSGLSVSMLSDILSLRGALSRDIYTPLEDLSLKRDEMRQALEGKMLLRKFEIDKAVGQSVCAVDACRDVRSQLFSEVTACAAFAVEGLSCNGSTIQYSEPEVQMTIHADSCFEGTDDIARAILSEMKIELAADSPHDVVFVRGAFDTEFYTILKALPLAMRLKETKTGAYFLKQLKPALAAFRKLAAGSAAGICVSLADYVYGSELLNGLQMQTGLDQGAAMTVILEPGEYTAPVAVVRDDVKRAAAVPIKDETFATLRDSIVLWLGMCKVIYFRPHEWTGAFRLELPGDIANSEEKLRAALGAVSCQCSTAGVTLPFPLYAAEKLTKQFIEAIPSLWRASIDDISNKHGGKISEILPLLLGTLNKR